MISGFSTQNSQKLLHRSVFGWAFLYKTCTGLACRDLSLIWILLSRFFQQFPINSPIAKGFRYLQVSSGIIDTDRAVNRKAFRSWTHGGDYFFGIRSTKNLQYKKLNSVRIFHLVNLCSGNSFYRKLVKSKVIIDRRVLLTHILIFLRERIWKIRKLWDT